MRSKARARRVAASSLAACTAALAVSAPAFADGPVYIADQFHKRLQAPRVLRLWASDSISKIAWDSWGGPTARGRGLISEHAYGKYTYTPTTVIASGIATCGGRRMYLRLTYVFHGQNRHARRYGCSLAGA